MNIGVVLIIIMQRSVNESVKRCCNGLEHVTEL